MSLLRPKWLRRRLQRKAEQTARDVLEALNESSETMNVSELVRATGHNGSMVAHALGFMQKQGFVRSNVTTHFSRTRIAFDAEYFLITKQGKQALKHGIGFLWPD